VDADNLGPHFRDFIILTDFSRCQGRVIGRVSRRFRAWSGKVEISFSEAIVTARKWPPPQQPYGFRDKDFP
jgi:hypothetical protein